MPRFLYQLHLYPLISPRPGIELVYDVDALFEARAFAGDHLLVDGAGAANEMVLLMFEYVGIAWKTLFVLFEKREVLGRQECLRHEDVVLVPLDFGVVEKGV